LSLQQFSNKLIEESTQIKRVTAEMLQTSSKSAVETTELTRSFGWDSGEAWQQHDIQELCRVMFDALEQKFKHTDQADLIQRLYEGKILTVFRLCSDILYFSQLLLKFASKHNVLNTSFYQFKI
jgi:hypothetical protein